MKKIKFYQGPFAVSVVLAVFFGLIIPNGKSLSADESQDRFVATRYITFDAFPLDFLFAKVGTAKSITICLPEKINLADIPLAILDLSADDIDEKKETQIFVNGHGPIQPPTSILDPGGQVVQAYIPIPTSFLKPGANEIKFIFADNLNFTTSGFTINDVSLLL